MGLGEMMTFFFVLSLYFVVSSGLPCLVLSILVASLAAWLQNISHCNVKATHSSAIKGVTTL